VAARGHRCAPVRAPGAHRAGPRGGAQRGARPLAAHRQAGAVRGQRRRRRRRGAARDHGLRRIPGRPRGRRVLSNRGRAARARRRGRRVDALGSRRVGVRSAPRRRRRVRAARPAHVLHGGRGQARAGRGTCAAAVRPGTPQGEIHSDIQKGFVRAEVIGWDALVDAGGYAARAIAARCASRAATT
jgi:hypothetical protein